MGLSDKIKWSQELADRVKADYDPYAVLVGFTSGGDSNIALKLATMFLKVDAAFTCDTTIAAPETLKNCEDVVSQYGLRHIIQAPRYNGISNNKETYSEIVKRHGFPGKTTTAHSWMYKWLKDHTVQNIIAQFRQRKRRRIVIVSGARRHESVRRMGTSEDITVIENTDMNWGWETKHENFYKVKNTILKKYGEHVGYDIQFIDGKKCFACNGTGIYHNHYYGEWHEEECYRCYAGWYKRPTWRTMTQILLLIHVVVCLFCVRVGFGRIRVPSPGQIREKQNCIQWTLCIKSLAQNARTELM